MLHGIPFPKKMKSVMYKMIRKTRQIGIEQACAIHAAIKTLSSTPFNASNNNI